MTSENLILKFDANPDEVILESKQCEFSGVKCQFQKWELDNITGYSVIYFVKDTSKFTKDELVQFTFKHLNIPSQSKCFFSSTRRLITIRFECTISK